MRSPLLDDVTRTIAAAPAVDLGQRRRREEWLASAAEAGALLRTGSPAHFTASALPVTSDGRRVCLVLHRRIGLWVQPGGHLEPSDRSVAEAAGRELREETGLAGTILPEPIHLSRHRAPCGPSLWHLDLQMLALAAEVDPTVSPESDDVAWFDTAALPSGIAPGVVDLVGLAAARLR